MAELESDNPEVYHHFMNGLHVIRRSEREWAGLSADLVIEQVLMRSLKTSGGLTRGRGFTEQQQVIWTLSMPVCASVHNTMLELTGVQKATGEQNQDISPSRMARDWKDTFKLVQYLKDRNPFECGEKLCNISNGVHAQASVNVDESKMIGSMIIAKMEGLKPSEHSFKRKDQSVTFAAKMAVKIDGDRVQVDPQLLFQRLSNVAACDLETALKYELYSFPPALFESPNLLLEAQKSSLADTILDLATIVNANLPTGARMVLDGGALLHRIPWNRRVSFDSILKSYVDYVKNRYGQAIVVFDGYESSSIKDMTHMRRCKGKQGVTITFTKDMNLAVTKEVFLSNKNNKQRFITMLGEELEANHCTVFHGAGDADCLIVEKVMETAVDNDVVLVGDDTDLLVLLLHQASEGNHVIYFAPEPKRNAKSRIWNIKIVKE